MFQIKQSEATAARRRIPVLFVSSTDGFTPTTPTSPAAYISTNGGTFVATTNAVTLETLAAGQSASGCYYLELTAAEVATLGVINVNVQSTNCRQYNAVIQVMAYDAYDVVRIGLTALPSVAAGANGGLPTGNASGQVTMAGTATGAITSSSFTAGAIDASAIATDAITSAELSATAVTEIAAGVWDEAYASHTTAGTFGKLMDIIRKSIYITEGTVSASGVPANSGSYFRTSLTSSVSGSFEGQTLVFTSGALIGQSMIVDTFTQTNGVITTLDTMVATPAASDTFVLIGNSHAYQPREIADGVLARKLDSTGNETSTTTANERTVRSALRYLRNKIDISASTMTITTEDDTTTAWTAALTTTAGLNPVTTVDPT